MKPQNPVILTKVRIHSAQRSSASRSLAATVRQDAKSQDLHAKPTGNLPITHSAEWMLTSVSMTGVYLDREAA